MCNTLIMIKITNGTYNILRHANKPEMAEKDFLECLILEKLFNDAYFSENFVFAGGATLSKTYQLSNRICQDLDLVCSCFDDIPDNHSRKQLDKFKRRFKHTVFTDICAKINDVINRDNQFKIMTDADWGALKNKETFISSPTLHILYASNFCKNVGHLSLEIIPRKYNTANIIEHRTVIPYAISQEFGDIPTVRYEQTFWDKVYALHSNTISPRPHFTQFYSRHYHDVAKLAHYVDLHGTLSMLDDIESFQSKYTLKRIPKLHTFNELQLAPCFSDLEKLQNDYIQMSDKFLGTPTNWQDIIQTLRELKAYLRTIQR